MKIKCLGMSEREQRDVIKIILAESFDGETKKIEEEIKEESHATSKKLIAPNKGLEIYLSRL